MKISNFRKRSQRNHSFKLEQWLKEKPEQFIKLQHEESQKSSARVMHFAGKNEGKH